MRKIQAIKDITGRMQLVLVCVRHGEANHNVDAKADMTETVTVPYTADGVLDTPLTPRGRTQVTQVGMMEIPRAMLSHVICYRWVRDWRVRGLIWR